MSGIDNHQGDFIVSVQVLTASALAALTLFMAGALVTVGSSSATPAPAVAAAQTAQANG